MPHLAASTIPPGVDPKAFARGEKVYRKFDSYFYSNRKEFLVLPHSKRAELLRLLVLTFLQQHTDTYDRACLRIYVQNVNECSQDFKELIIALPEQEIRGRVNVRQAAPDNDLRPPAGTTEPRMKAMAGKKRPRTSLRTAARSVTRRNKSKTGSSKNRNYPGYVPPNRINTKSISINLPIDMADAFKMAAVSEKSTMKKLLTEFITEKIKTVLPPERRKALIKQEIARVRAKYSQLRQSLTHS